ncbi:hypothetical protein LV89_04775 [Arcicella aurantiaca]|uniref:Lipocalin-like domain-containing protein n=1 Tax=Arcicella aurantiaca TaxID=591202 RepID=A0A316DGW0_9BACT|nr:hypothetical protein [Arcicella aurantiaca]PWK16752.1 hypothetical protein LV89_04775 [Arcicella aurantiaca]
MKKLLFIISLVLLGSTSFAQTTTNPFKNTQWKGTVNIPDPTGAIIAFEEGKVMFKAMENDSPIEELSYTIEGNILTMKKIAGSSPCTENEVAKLSFEIIKDTLILKVVSDDCKARGAAFTDEQGNAYVWKKDK